MNELRRKVPTQKETRELLRQLRNATAPGATHQQRIAWLSSLGPEQVPDTLDAVDKLLSRLHWRDKQVLWLRLGLDRGEPRTREELAEHFGLPPYRVGQFETRAIQRVFMGGNWGD